MKPFVAAASILVLAGAASAANVTFSYTLEVVSIAELNPGVLAGSVF